MNLVLYCIILSRKPESIPSHRIKDIIPLHSFFSCDYIKSSVTSGMAHMQTLSRRIRKFYECIKFRFLIFVFCMKSRLFFPAFLPLFFYMFRTVFFKNFFHDLSLHSLNFISIIFPNHKVLLFLWKICAILHLYNRALSMNRTSFFQNSKEQFLLPTI